MWVDYWVGVGGGGKGYVAPTSYQIIGGPGPTLSPPPPLPTPLRNHIKIADPCMYVFAVRPPLIETIRTNLSTSAHCKKYP